MRIDKIQTSTSVTFSTHSDSCGANRNKNRHVHETAVRFLEDAKHSDRRIRNLVRFLEHGEDSYRRFVTESGNLCRKHGRDPCFQTVPRNFGPNLGPESSTGQDSGRSFGEETESWPGIFWKPLKLRKFTIEDSD